MLLSVTPNVRVSNNILTGGIGIFVESRSGDCDVFVDGNDSLHVHVTLPLDL